MLDLKQIRTDYERVEHALLARQHPLDELEKLPELDRKRRELIQETEQLKNRRNVVSQEIAVKKRSGEAADALIAEMKEVSDQIKQLDERLRAMDAEVEQLLYHLPNIPHKSVPVGQSEEDNVVVRHWGERTTFDFTAKAHWDLGVDLDILDFESAANVTGSRFVFYKGLGARLERALINFMMDLHSEQHGYQEMLPPFIVNQQSLIGTGQLPKFAEDVFRLEDSDQYLVPTSEVPVTNYHSGDILAKDDLPAKYVAYSPCFRSEAGSAGRDTRGLIRLHQFNKVELVAFSLPEQSYDVLEQLTNHAETVLRLLELPYRVIVLCTGDLGFASAKTYDLEVWLPHSKTYREISSCSNFEEFHARRANIKFRREAKGKTEFVHTLNGSGLAIGRTVAAILENYQQADGSVRIPKVLQPYMNGIEVIAP